MPGPEEWRSRCRGRKTEALHRIRPIGSLHSFVRQPGRRRAAYTGPADESRRTHHLAGPELGPGDPARLPRHARPVLDRHLPAGLHRHRQGDRRVAGRDAADAVGVPVRLRDHESLPWRAVRQLRPPTGGARRARRVHARLGRLRALAAHRRAGLLSRPAGHVGGRRDRRLARRHPRHVPARRRAAGDVAGDDLLRRRAGGRADDRRLPLRPRRLAFDLLAAHRRRRRPVRAQLEAAARDAARVAQAAVQRRATSFAATGAWPATRAS